MITGELKSKVDKIWDTMWSGGISNPLSVIEQLTYLLFIKRLDELHTLKERKAARGGTPIQEPVFAADQDRLRWSRFKDAAPEQLFETVRDGVFPFIKSLGQKGEADGEGGSTYSHHMKDAHGPCAGHRRRPTRRHQHGRQRHQGRSLRVHARQDCHRRTERPVPHAAPHHPSDGRHDRPHAQGRDLRPGLRDGGLPRCRLRAPRRAPQRHHLQGRQGPLPLQ